MKDIYKVVSIKDGKQDMEAILLVLREIQAGRLKKDLKLLNYYFGVPVSYPVTIDKIEADSIECSMHQAQSVVLGLQKQTLLTSSAFPQGLGVHCFVEYMNVKNCFSVLGRFTYVSIHAQRRGAIRVRIAEQMPASYCSEGQVIEGRIFDISVTGIAIQTSQPKPLGMQENGSIQFAVQGTKLELPSSLISSIERDGIFIHTFKIEVTSFTDNIISQYIFNRQVEIIRELKELFQ